MKKKCKVPNCRLHSDKGNLCAWYRDIIQCAEWRNYKNNNMQ